MSNFQNIEKVISLHVHFKWRIHVSTQYVAENAGRVNDTLCLLHHKVENYCQRMIPLGAILNLTSSSTSSTFYCNLLTHNLSQDLPCYL